MKLLGPLETKASPFKTTPKTNEHPHWVRPELVAQIKFTEWTADAKLRHPVYLGLRDDKKPGDVRREKKLARHSASAAHAVVEPGAKAGMPDTKRAAPRTAKTRSRATDDARPTPNAAGRTTKALDTAAVVDQLDALEKARRDGVLDLPDGEHLKVTNLHKVFWPKLKLTKGDLFRYYARVANFVLPAVADRPLVMKRFPNGIAAAPFYQHRAPEVPAGVRSAVVSVVEKRPQIIGGSLLTLLYMTQLAADLAGPVVFARAARRVRRLQRLRPRPVGGRAVREGARRGAVDPGRARHAGRRRRGEDVRIGRPSYLRAAPAGDAVRRGHALLPDCRRRRRAEAPGGGDHGTDGRGARQARLHRLPPEHPRQDARDRLQRARERILPACPRR